MIPVANSSTSDRRASTPGRTSVAAVRPHFGASSSRPSSTATMLRVIVCSLLFLARLSCGVPSSSSASAASAAAEGDGGMTSAGGVEKPRVRKVLVVLLNGFRWDYVSRDLENLPNFQRLLDEGVRAEYLESCFPSLRYPAWTTLSTGRWPEDHGVIGNYMYDRSTEDIFDLLNTTTTRWRKWWQNAEPIWITAEDEGHKAALYQWSRCDVDFKGKKPTICTGYNASQSATPEDLRNHVTAALADLEAKVDLAMVYNEAVGNAGRRFGPDSSETKTAVRNIDVVIGNLLDAVNASSVADSLNVLILSDHGMTSTDSKTKIIVEDFLVKQDIRKVVGREAYMNILPHPKAEKSVQRALSKMPRVRFYRKHAIPPYLNFGKAPLGLVFLVLAEPDGYLQGISSTQQIPRGPEHGIPEMGLSGYDPTFADMRGVFFALGPDFPVSYTGSPLKLVDIHAMLKRLLDMEDDVKAKAGDSNAGGGGVSDGGGGDGADAVDVVDAETDGRRKGELDEMLERIEEYVKSSASTVGFRGPSTASDGWRRLAVVFLPMIALFLGRLSGLPS